MGKEMSVRTNNKGTPTIAPIVATTFLLIQTNSTCPTEGEEENMVKGDLEEAAICTQSGHAASSCYYLFDQNFQVNNQNQKAAMITSPSIVNYPYWYAYIGATNHLAADLNNLSIGSEYDGS